ncbi:hypothetical protein CCP3SC5AM1_3460001 [Gammaproteobacteria bacterium]
MVDSRTRCGFSFGNRDWSQVWIKTLQKSSISTNKVVKSMWLNVFMVRSHRYYKLSDTTVYHTAYVEFALVSVKQALIENNRIFRLL